MLKFVFFLCAFLLAGAVCAKNVGTQNDEKDVTPSVIRDIRDKVIEIVNDAIQQVSEKVQEIQKTTTDYIKKLKEEAVKITKSVYEQIIAAQKKVKSEVDKAIKEAIHYNVTECAEMAKAFEETGIQALAESSRCITDVLEDADGYSENIRQSSDAAVKNLTSIKDEAEVCVKNVNDLSSAAKAFLCVNVAAAKGTWTATKNVPALMKDLGKLTWRITTLLPELAYCSTVKGVKKVNKDSEVVVEKVKECIKARKAESEKSE